MKFWSVALTCTLLLLPALFFTVYAQQDSIYVVEEIIFKGNEKTNESYLLKELTFAKGDTFPASELKDKLKWGKSLLFRTSLFTSVSLTHQEIAPNRLRIIIALKERWYILPIPSITLADRNFNEWWEDYDHDLHRLIYSLNLSINNLWGNNEQIKIGAYAGFNQRLNLQFIKPYFSKTSSFGAELELDFARGREVAVDTRSDKLYYLQEDRFIKDFMHARFGITYRSHPFVNHQFYSAYHNWHVDESIIHENPDFLGESRQQLQYISLGYELEWDKTDHPSYPLIGHLFCVFLSKKGLGTYDQVNLFKIEARMEKYSRLWRDLFFENTLTIGSTLPSGEAYIFNEALGYGKGFIRGYELYVIDGPYYALNRNTLKWKFWDFNLNSRLILIEEFQNIPFNWFATLHFDHGYVSSPANVFNNQLINQWLYGFGGGIDIVTYYDYYISLSFAYNHMGEKGVFLHLNL